MKRERHCTRWTQNEEMRLRQLREEGKTVAECALALGRTFKSVECKLGVLGIVLEPRWSYEEKGGLVSGEKPASRSPIARKVMLCRLRKAGSRKSIRRWKK